MHVDKALTGCELLAIWKRDLPYLRNSTPDNPEQTFLQVFSKNHILVPMEPAVAGYLHDEKLPFVFPDALLTKAIRNACSEKAWNIARDWVSRSGVGSPPSFLFKSIEFQLITLFTAEAIANSWRIAGVRKLRALQHGSLKTDGYWIDGDIPQAVWRDLLEDAYDPVIVSESPSSLYRQIRTFIKHGKRAIRRSAADFRRFFKETFLGEKIDYRAVQDSIAVFLHPSYIERDAYIIQQLKQTAPVCLFLYKPRKEELDSAAEILGLPVFRIFDDHKAASIDLEPYIEPLREYIRDVPTAGNILTQHIRLSHGDITSASAWLTRLFTTYRPRLACSSQVSDVEFRYFERTCLDMAIPVIGVPHAMIQDTRGILFSDEDAYISALSSEICEKCHDEDALAVRTCSIEGIFCRDEYPTRIKNTLPQNKSTILFLYGACQNAPGLIYCDGMAERCKLLMELSNLPEALRAGYAVRHKLHPLGVDMELFQVAGVDPSSILPLESNLENLLGQISVAIPVNYVSSPSLQSILGDVPTIHLNTMGAENIYYSTAPEKIFHDNGAAFVFSVQEMWDIIKKILHDDLYRQEIIARQSAIKSLLHPSSSMTLSRLAAEAIEKTDAYLSFPMRGKLVVKD